MNRDRSVGSEITELEHELQSAVERQDRDALERLLAPQFRLITSRAGNPLDRSSWIDAAVGPFRVASSSLRDFTVVLDGDTAVVSRRQEQDASMAGVKAHANWLATDVWIRRGTAWQLLARHAEPIDEDA